MLCPSVLQNWRPRSRLRSALLHPVAMLLGWGPSSVATSTESSAPSTESTVSASFSLETAAVGAPRDFFGHADGTTSAYNSVEKWVSAALRTLDHETTDLVETKFFTGVVGLAARVENPEREVVVLGEILLPSLWFLPESGSVTAVATTYSKKAQRWSSLNPGVFSESSFRLYLSGFAASFSLSSVNVTSNGMSRTLSAALFLPVIGGCLLHSRRRSVQSTSVLFE